MGYKAAEKRYQERERDVSQTPTASALGCTRSDNQLPSEKALNGSDTNNWLEAMKNRARALSMTKW